MLEGLMQVDGGSATLPFVRMFYGAPSEYLWEDDFGQVHTTSQGECGQQGDALMPLLFALGQHGALETTARTLRAGEFMFAFLDDIYFITAPNRVGAIYATLQEALWAHACIAIHLGKTKVWNASGIRPEICTVLERMARETDRTARVWRGSEVPEDEQGMKVLGTPLGHPQYVRRFLSQLSEKHKVLLHRIPRLDNVQSAWLLLAHCAAARANYSLRCVEPQDVELFARTHDFQMRQCLSSILQFNLEGDSVTLPLSLGGLGLRSALRTSKAAYWASWADCLAMISERHPEVAPPLMVDELEGALGTSCLEAVASVARELTGVCDFDPPTWHALAPGVRPASREPEDCEPGCSRDGWQHEAASRVESHFRDSDVFTRVEAQLQGE